MISVKCMANGQLPSHVGKDDAPTRTGKELGKHPIRITILTRLAVDQTEQQLVLVAPF
jgi:hypothetical protein